MLSKRKLVSYDNDKGWVKRFSHSDFHNFHYSNELHELHHVSDWDKADILREWSVALVDHLPDYRRITEIRLLAHWATYIVVHDSDEKFDKTYHYSEIYPLFKYRKTFNLEIRRTDVLSNFVDLGNL
jgi:hypothetical protein